jgi:hypothetical protein
VHGPKTTSQFRERYWTPRWDLRLQSWIDDASRLAGRNLTDAEGVRFRLDGDPVAQCPGLSPSDGAAAVDEGLTPEEKTGVAEQYVRDRVTQ